MALFNIFKKKDKTSEETAAPKKVVAQEAPKTEAPVAEPKEKAAPAEKKPAPKKEAPVKEEKAAPAEKKAAPKKEAPKKEEKAPEAKVEETAPAVDEKAPITGKFEIKKSKDDRYVFNLYAANKVIVATSQVYSSARSAVTGIQSVINNAATAPVEDQTLANWEPKNNPKWEIYKDKGGAFRFRLNASNGQTICHSQGYTTKASCKNGIDSIIRSSRNAEIDKAYLDS